MEFLFGLLLQFLFIFSLIALISYILFSLGLMGIAKKTETKGAWMAWVPLFSVYLTGKIAFNKLIGWVLVILSFIVSVGTGTTSINGEVIQSGFISPEITLIALSIMSIITLASLYKIYKKVSNKAVVMIIFTILSCGLLVPIFLFAIRKNNVIA